MAITLFICATVLFGFAVYTVVDANSRLAPTIIVPEGIIQVSIEDEDAVLLEGITAKDLEDGDISEHIMIESLSDLQEENTRVITVAVVDSDNNVVRATRTIQYTDYREPVLALTQAIRIEKGTSFEASNFFRAWDVLDGNITGRILQYEIEGSQFDMNSAGFYPLQISVTNSVNDTVAVEVTVEVYDPIVEALAAKIDLSEYIHYLEIGDEFDPLDYVKFVSVDGVGYDITEDGILENTQDREQYEAAKEMETELTSEEFEEKYEVRTYDFTNIKVTNPVNTKVSGWYEISYSIVDLAGSSTVRYALVYVSEEE